MLQRHKDRVPYLVLTGSHGFGSHETVFHNGFNRHFERLSTFYVHEDLAVSSNNFFLSKVGKYFIKHKV